MLLDPPPAHAPSAAFPSPAHAPPAAPTPAAPPSPAHTPTAALAHASTPPVPPAQFSPLLLLYFSYILYS